MELSQRKVVRKSPWTLTGCVERDNSPQTIEIQRVPFRIGRRPDLELSLASRVVSGLHAELVDISGVLCLRDLASTNGTFVNGRRISNDTLLAQGDWIEIGDVHLRVDSGEFETPASPFGYHKTQFFDQHDLELANRGLMTLMERRELQPCFQPIHDLHGGDVFGYEFLARSQVDGVATPGEMFAAAERSGREVELSMLCREQGVEHSVGLPSKLPLFLNTHPHEKLVEDVVPQMADLRKVQPGRPLVLEIHEGAITEPGLVRTLRAELREIGVQLAFDDFGAGQARIRELICAPSDYIKFDAAFVRDLQEVSGDQVAFFRSIIDGVRKEGARTVAEGIETAQMVELCREIGFDLVQGYAMSRPMMMYPRHEQEEPTVDLRAETFRD